MTAPRATARASAAALAVLACTVSLVTAGETERPLCRPLLDEAGILLDDATLQVDLARSEVEAFGEIYRLIQGLWDAEAIQRMSYLEAKHDFDSARLKLERARLLLERQAALVERYDAICSGEPRRTVDAARKRYLRADCDALVKSVEAAEVDVEFAEQFLASVHDLRAGDVATRQAVILAELDVALESKRLADARARAAACRRALEPPPAE